jgi:hypothetical protein
MKRIFNRRTFIQRTAGLAITLPVITSLKINVQEVKNPKILFRMGWNSNDNDDIALIPSLYRIAQKSLLKCEFFLWLEDPDPDIIEMLNRNFTGLKIITGNIDNTGQPTTDELRNILSETALFFYSNGPAMEMDWADENKSGIETRSLKYCFDNNIPYAILGLDGIPKEGKAVERFAELTNGARYIFTTSSLIDKKLKDENIKILNWRQIPNPLFAFDLRNESQSREIFENNNLTGMDFLTLDFRVAGLSEEDIKTYSHKIIMMITSWVEKTDKYVCILPNNPSDIEATLNNIYTPLEAGIKSKVIFFPEVLTPDTAASIYEKSKVVSGMSLFPACSAVHSGVPVLFLSTVDLSDVAGTIEDMGLKNSIQELNTQSGETLSGILLRINNKYVDGIIESDKAREYAMRKLKDQFDDIYKFVIKSTGLEKNPKKKNKKK